MAYETGTATDHADLLDKIITFAVANGWALIEDHRATTGVILQGEGAGGTDEIFVGLRIYANAISETYGFELNGFTGYNDGAAWTAQPGTMAYNEASNQYLPSIPLWNDSIPYWLSVTGRRIIVVAKVSTVYEFAHLGFMLPYGTPGQWPYPLVIAGSAQGKMNWTDATATHTHGLIPYTPGFGQGPLRVLDAAGAWQSPTISTGSSLGYTQSGTWPFAEAGTSANRGFERLKECPGAGVWPLLPVIVFKVGSSGDEYRGNVWGEIDGVKHIAGLGNAVENTATVGADTYLVVKNVFRSSVQDFWALRLA